MRVREISDLEMSIATHLKKFSYQQRSLPYCLDYSGLLITRILKAVADGELELPGEVARWERGVDRWGKLYDDEVKWGTLIALRKEEK